MYICSTITDYQVTFLHQFSLVLLTAISPQHPSFFCFCKQMGRDGHTKDNEQSLKMEIERWPRYHKTPWEEQDIPSLWGCISMLCITASGHRMMGRGSSPLAKEEASQSKVPNDQDKKVTCVSCSDSYLLRVASFLARTYTASYTRNPPPLQIFPHHTPRRLFAT